MATKQLKEKTATIGKAGMRGLDPIRKKQIRLGVLEDTLLDTLSRFNDEEDKQMILEIIEKLKQPKRKRCS